MSNVTKLYPYVMDHNETADNPSAESQYYMNMFKAYEGFPRFASWNWPASLFGAGWFLYRKMYLYAAIIFIFEVIALTSSYEGLYGNVLFGIFGNAIYRHDLEKRIAKNSTTKGTSTLLAMLYAVFVASIAIFVVLLELKKNGTL